MSTDNKSSFSYRSMPNLSAYIDRIGAVELNFRRYMVKEPHGAYYREKALIRIKGDGTITCTSLEHRPTKEEAAAIKIEVGATKWPKSIGAKTIAKLRKPGRKYFEFWDTKRKTILMVQERVDTPDGGKYYVPWTFYDDGEWRMMEPDHKLPFWKPPEDRQKSRIMVHEGAKAADFIDGLVNDPKRKKELAAHPWGDELKDYEHWGLIGGALAPHRADYAELIEANPDEVIYVCDRDTNGETALQEVSKEYGRTMKGIKFGMDFPYGFDMADPMPHYLFKNGRWHGPRLDTLKQAATFATEQVPGEDKKPLTVIRKSFAQEWVHSSEPDVFIHKDWPNRILTPTVFDDKMAPFCTVDMPSRLMRKHDAIKSAVIKYEPGRNAGIYGGGREGLFMNTHMPSDIKAEKGDYSKWIDYMEYLLPIEKDRIEMMRWVATLIARPGTKMQYAVLLISETQGVGKSTLGELILTPLLGEDNCSAPDENDVVDSDYTYWLAHKRLAVVNEIYAGHSAKAYNKLKDIITGKRISIKQKYMANYSIDNWIHIFACSNNFNALRLTGDDRRWLIPKVTETKRPQKYWSELNEWLKYAGGLNFIKQWAFDFLEKHDAVGPGDTAPWSAAKMGVIEAGYSDGMMLAADVLETLKGAAGFERSVMLDSDFTILIKDNIYDGRASDKLERPSTIRKIARTQGWFISEHRTRLGDGTQGRLICSDYNDAQMPPYKLFKEVRPLRVFKLGKQKLSLDHETGLINIDRTMLE